MSHVRKFSKTRGSFTLSIPKEVVEAMGAMRGSPVHMEQPFSDTLLIGSLERRGMSVYPEFVRCIGWMAGSNGRMPGGMSGFGRAVADEGVCVVCRLWPGQWDVGFGPLCRFCCQELTIAIEFRRRPSQPELSMLAADDGARGGAVSIESPAASAAKT